MLQRPLIESLRSQHQKQMIKFFRHIRRQLLSDNKTGKYLKYAFGEIVLVVIGILIALQLNGWKEISNKKNKEKEILQDIHAEFIQNKTQLAEVVSFHKISRDNVKNIVQLFPIDPNTVSMDSLTSYLSNIWWRYTFNPTQSSINALVGTSSFDIISNKELRNLLIIWTDIVADYQEEEITAKEIQINIYEPFFYKYFPAVLDAARFNLTDPRFKSDILTSIEFENMIYSRLNNLEDILGEELKTIQNKIDQIIILTDPST